MTTRENYISLVKRQGYEFVPIHFGLCPELENYYHVNICNTKPYTEYYGFASQFVGDMVLPAVNEEIYYKYYDHELAAGTKINQWGVAHEPGSKEAKHFTRMLHPLAKVDSLEQMKEYPFPDYQNADAFPQVAEVKEIVENDRIAAGHMACTVWETAWGLRSMEELMMDMMSDDPMAEFLLDKVTEIEIIRAESYARAGTDIIYLGDDIGMQSSVMMSESLYCTWLKPRLKKIIDAARAIKPDVLIYYHSCGYIRPFIPHLIEAGIDILNPIQPESMDFEEIHSEFGDVISFCGTIGTQTTLPFGTPEDVRKAVFKNLDIAGPKGGLLVEPTHMLEPEVPFENIEAYVKACRDYSK